MNNQMTEQERQFYFVQHKFLPHLFYSGTKPFVERILTLGGYGFVDLLCAMNDDEESDEEYICPYIGKRQVCRRSRTIKNPRLPIKATEDSRNIYQTPCSASS